jgi:hypothetical protein
MPEADLSDLLTYGWMTAMGLIAGTFLPFVPGSSEVVLAGFIASGTGRPEWLIAAAVLGNVIGGLLNYCAGRYVSGLSGRSWFPATEAQLAYVGPPSTGTAPRSCCWHGCRSSEISSRWWRDFSGRRSGCSWC